jgi:hypothetical protein
MGGDDRGAGEQRERRGPVLLLPTNCRFDRKPCTMLPRITPWAKLTTSEAPDERVVPDAAPSSTLHGLEGDAAEQQAQQHQQMGSTAPASARERQRNTANKPPPPRISGLVEVPHRGGAGHQVARGSRRS